MTVRGLAASLLGLLVGVGCTSGRSFVVVRAEYDAYKATRVAETFEERVGAAHAYLEDYPDGAYATEVRAYFAKAEPLFRRLSKTTIPGMRRYLTTLPNGPHSGDMKASLDAALIAAGRPDELSKSAAELARKAKEAKASREAAAKGFDAWLTLALDPVLYQSALDAAPPGFLGPFRQTPEPTCRPVGSGRTCEKPVQTTFVAPIAGESGLVERAWFYGVSAELGEGDVIRAIAIDGPALFLRLHEASAPAADPDPDTAVAESLDGAADHLTRAFEARVGSLVGCVKEAAPPVIVSLACKGLALEGIAGLEGAPDRIVVKALVEAPPPEPPPSAEPPKPPPPKKPKR